jgi:hypothetical protein
MIIFTSNITKVNVFPKYQPRSYESTLAYRQNVKKRVGTKFLVFPVYEIVPHAVIREEGLFNTTEEFYCDLKEFKSDYYYFEDGVLYEKPHCTIYMNDRSSKEVHFESVDVLNAYVEEIKSKAPHIII